jgi:hypothetical protein
VAAFQELLLLLLYYYFYYYYYYDSTALCLAVDTFSVSWSYTQSIGLLGWGISPSQGLYLRIEQHTHRIKAQNTESHDVRVRTTILVFERAKTIHATDRAAAVIPRGFLIKILCFAAALERYVQPIKIYMISQDQYKSASSSFTSDFIHSSSPEYFPEDL